MRILVICDDYWHPASTVRQGLAPLAAQGFAFDWLTDANHWSAAQLEHYPLVILSKSNNVTAADQSPWVTPAVEAAFLTYVQQGHGLLAIHSGTAGYKDCATLRGLLGGVFVQHPEQCAVTVAPQSAHALNAGVTPFTAKDEHYFMQLDDAAAEVFLTAQSDHGTQPAGWTRTEGQGRVCVLTPGHNVEVWLQAAFQTSLVNALKWCAPAAA